MNNKEDVPWYVTIYTYIGLIIFTPALYYSMPLFVLSSRMIYNKIYLWMKYGISIDLSTYNCITSNSKYCYQITSNPPFNYIPDEFIRWIIEPKDWLGLHSIIKPLIENIPIWVVSFLSAVLILVLWALVVSIIMYAIVSVIGGAQIIIKTILKK